MKAGVVGEIKVKAKGEYGSFIENWAQILAAKEWESQNLRWISSANKSPRFFELQLPHVLNERLD